MQAREITEAEEMGRRRAADRLFEELKNAYDTKDPDATDDIRVKLLKATRGIELGPEEREALVQYGFGSVPLEEQMEALDQAARQDGTPQDLF
jgi:hypothetical protein